MIACGYHLGNMLAGIIGGSAVGFALGVFYMLLLIRWSRL